MITYETSQPVPSPRMLTKGNYEGLLVPGAVIRITRGACKGTCYTVLYSNRTKNFTVVATRGFVGTGTGRTSWFPTSDLIAGDYAEVLSPRTTTITLYPEEF